MGPFAVSDVEEEIVFMGERESFVFAFERVSVSVSEPEESSSSQLSATGFDFGFVTDF